MDAMKLNILTTLIYLAFNITIISNTKICKEKPIEQNIENADIILAGVVKKLDQSYSNGPYGAFIQIFRIIKGHNQVYQILNVNILNELKNNASRRNQKASLNGIILYVKNFGTNSICISHVKQNDVRIFLLRIGVKKTLHLNSSLIQPILRESSKHEPSHLTNNQFTQINLKCPKSISSICNYGSLCVINRLNNFVNCECDIKCEKYDPIHLCGNDGLSYQSLCHLKQTKCLQQRAIKIIDYNTCEQLEESLCKTKFCPNYGKCRIDEQGFFPRCVCPNECDSEDLKLDSSMLIKKELSSKLSKLSKLPNELISNTLCGNDGNNYENLCDLKKKSCKSNKEIKIFYFGKCDPCENVVCQHPQVCRLNNKREPKCVCDLECSNDFLPVCANDGRTYFNECYLKLENCRSNRSMSVYQHSECSSINNPCDQISCDHFASYCEIDKFGKAFCKCEENCEKTLKYVCGSDGVTYENECVLHRQSCLTNQLVSVLHIGICGNLNPCVDHRCNFGGTCELTNNIPSCKCVECPEIYKPVCGTNDVTYNNICKLRRDSCQQQILIDVSYEGICDACKKKSCLYHGKCVTDEYNNAKCVCENNCQDVNIPVCGDDGESYNSLCHLNFNSCVLQKNISVIFNGYCDLCMELKCEIYPVDYICGSDGITHKNECYLNHASCVKKKKITALHKGNCISHFKNKIDIEKPTSCNGSLIDMHTGREYICSPEKNCPGESYCDSSSRCCFKTKPDFFQSVNCFTDLDCNNENLKCIRNSCIFFKSCMKSKYGCCDDGVTQAKGPNNTGCPKSCNCHPAGSLNNICDQETGQCSCRPGVTGKLCDACAFGYWGIKNIIESKQIGCLPCLCNKYGSLREDCEQESGECKCKNNVYGLKCAECTDGKELNESGICVSASEKQEAEIQTLCTKIQCPYPGSYCKIQDGEPKCVCDAINCTSDGIQVCAQDGQTYASKCDLLKFSCAKQSKIKIAHIGQCSQANFLNMIFNDESRNKDFKKSRNKNINPKNGSNLNKTKTKTVNSNHRHHSHNINNVENNYIKFKNKLELKKGDDNTYRKKSNTIYLASTTNEEPMYSLLNMTLVSSTSSSFKFQKKDIFKELLVIISNFVFCLHSQYYLII